jgi:hypothetical protein
MIAVVDRGLRPYRSTPLAAGDSEACAPRSVACATDDLDKPSIIRDIERIPAADAGLQYPRLSSL